MPAHTAEAFEDGIDLQIGLIEAYVPNDGTAWSGYPFVALRKMGTQEMRTFRTLILENPYLRATFLPGMGGRLISLFDKRTGTEILRRHTFLEPLEGGPRGATIREGVQISLDGTERLSALGNVASQIEVQVSEEDDAAVWMAETAAGSLISYHARWSMPADRAELTLEVRALNRSHRQQAYNGGISAYLGEGEVTGNTFYSPGRKAGLGVFPVDDRFQVTLSGDGVLHVNRWAQAGLLAPRQVDTWNLRLVPFSGMSHLSAASPDAAASLRDGVLEIQSASQRLAHKVLILTKSGETLEATVDLYPEHVLQLPLDGIEASAAAIRDPSKRELLQFSTKPSEDTASPILPPEPYRQTIQIDSSVDELRRALLDVAQRHHAAILLAMREFSEGNNQGAQSLFERTLNYNAEDPLLWWAKAMAGRMAGGDVEAELLNAHYLAPLEPALRAESYLSQPVSLDPEPSPLLAPLKENPEEFIEVACLLIEADVFDQASRWIDEALRHENLPMLRYLLAYCLLTGTKLDMEASDQVRLAGLQPLAPPFPYRDIEKKAIDTLLAAFPQDGSLRILAGLLESNR